MWISKRNAEGYSDPTAYEALSSIIHKEKHSAKVKADFPKVYICSPFAGDMEMNVKRALKYCRFALARARLPIAPHCYFPRFMDDGIPSERELALRFGLRLLGGCREIWVFGRHISKGMAAEIAEARRRGIPVRYYTDDCEEVSGNGSSGK